ncbi:Eco57I restriction-modification methylase domain-containing protein [Bacteriovorax sp. BAL6_X]|uniref:Eco57I restriction-modification methylase domain-containing protein n=1 Tax=Bacteriovorax sp. BAL6_X TaxID=1201290 RepID=UPI00041F73C5|nr:Eco57I restriction-modification methylase domain-containing protein [Bacteriovorax sp. BAL6_X]
MGALLKTNAHVVDVLGNVIGRDQPILRMEKAVEMVSLIGKENFMNKDVVFFDPFCKAGELLLSCAYQSCLSLLKEESRLMNTQEIFEEIFMSKRYYALAPDERHHKLSLRTFLGNENSHRDEFNHVIRNGNYLSEVDGTLNRAVFKKEFEDMINYIKKDSGAKKIIAVGNPPYQESDSGFGGSARAIYNHFVEALMDSDDIDEFVVVIPSRWFAVGKGVDKFRERILASSEIKSLHYFSKSKTVFPTVDVLGGVCFFHYSSSHSGKTSFVEGDVVSKIDISQFDIIPDDPKAYSIINKIMSNHNVFINEIAWSRNPYGLPSTFFRDNEEADSNDVNSIKCYSRGRKIKLTTTNEIRKNNDKVNFYKVVIPSAYAPGSKTGVRRVTLPVNQFFILNKDEITTETYSVIDIFKTKTEAERFVKYLQTDFARYLLGLRKITQHIPKDRWAWVPYLDMKSEWTDEKLFEKFNLTSSEIANIKKKVEEWS